MSGAVVPTVRVQEAPFDLAAESAALTAGRVDVGGLASFVGLCRADDGLAALVLEHYPGMTERAIAAHRRAGLRPLAADRLHRHPPAWPAGAGGADRPGADRLLPPRRGAGKLRLPDRLAEDPGALLEARGIRRRRGALGRGQGGGRCRRGALGRRAIGAPGGATDPRRLRPRAARPGGTGLPRPAPPARILQPHPRPGADRAGQCPALRARRGGTGAAAARRCAVRLRPRRGGRHAARLPGRRCRAGALAPPHAAGPRSRCWTRRARPARRRGCCGWPTPRATSSSFSPRREDRGRHPGGCGPAGLAGGAERLPAGLQRYRRAAGADRPGLRRSGTSRWSTGRCCILFHWRVTLWLPLAAQGLVLSWLLWLVQRSLGGGDGGAASCCSAPGWRRRPRRPGSPRCCCRTGWRRPWCWRCTCWASPGTGCGRVGARRGRAAGAAGRRRAPVPPADRRRAGPAGAGGAAGLAAGAALRPAAAGRHGAAAGDECLGAWPLGAVALWRGLRPGAAGRRRARRADHRGALPGRPAGISAAGPGGCRGTATNSSGPGRARSGPRGRTARLPGGPIALAPEAATILAETLRREPLGVLRAAAGNAWRQLGMARVGDTLGPENLQASVGRQLALGFPAAEQARFAAGLQARGNWRRRPRPSSCCIRRRCCWVRRARCWPAGGRGGGQLGAGALRAGRARRQCGGDRGAVGAA